MKFLRKHIVVE